MTHEATGGEAPARQEDSDRTALCNNTDNSNKLCISDNGQQQCWICQQPIAAPGKPRRCADEPVHDECHPDTAANGRLVTDGSGHTCDACGASFATLTKLRLHEKDDCQARATYDELDPDGDDVGREAAEGLLTCRECGTENPGADYDETTSYDGEDFHLICEFACRSCGFENENRVVLTGVDEETLEDLPPHLQPDDQEIATDGGVPATWGAAPVDKPDGLPQDVSPQDLADAVADYGTLLEVTNAVRAGREHVGLALGRLNLLDQVERTDGRALRPVEDDAERDRMEKVTVRMPAGLLERLDDAADGEAFPSRSAAIRAAVQQAFPIEGTDTQPRQAAADGGESPLETLEGLITSAEPALTDAELQRAEWALAQLREGEHEDGNDDEDGVPDDCPTCGRDYDRYIGDFGRYAAAELECASIHFSEHHERGPEIFIHERDADEHRLVGAEPAQQPDDAPRDANDDPVFEDQDAEPHIVESRAAEDAEPLADNGGGE